MVIRTQHITKHNELVRWLRLPCQFSDDINEDQDYSDYYKGLFNITDTKNFFYDNNNINVDIDIDFELNLELAEEDERFEDFTDHIPVIDGVGIDMNIDIEQKILILPGSNHSNCNYLYKMLKIEASHKDEYSIPYLSNDPKIPYTGELKNASMMINKEDVYNFVKNNSVNKI